MSYNGSGTFQINTSGQPVVAGTVISSTAFNALTADLATGLSTAITKDGQTTATARIPFAAGINSSLTTDSSSTSTGSIITAGGVGIAKALYVGTNANVAGTLGVTGVATFSAAPIYSSLTASSAVATDASKNLVSVTNTGTGNNVLATSPTLVTPVLGAASATSITVAAGAVGTPSITTTGDTNTGIFFPAADTIAFAEGGAEVMRIDSSGNVGIGTASPTAKLDVSGTAKSTSMSLNGVAIGDYSLYSGMVTRVSNGGGIGINSANSTDNAYIYFGSGTTSGAQQSAAIGRIGGDVLAMYTASSERMRITSSGNLLVGTTTTLTAGIGISIGSATSSGQDMLSMKSSTTAKVSFAVNAQDSENFSLSATAAVMGRNASSGRSLNAGGTLNASGADYAEYMTKAGDFTVAKGDVIGIDAQGKLTNVFANAVSFVVKSTDPSYVGGDTWGNEETLGLTKPTNDATDEEKTAFSSALEAARQLVDRIAFAGQVPVNVIGATAGQYIIPINENDAIKGQAVTSPTFEQYQQAVGKVIAIEADGRARIIVKVA